MQITKVFAYHKVTKKRICLIYSSIDQESKIYSPQLEDWYVIDSNYGPAVISFYEDGTVFKEEWYRHGNPFNADGPLENEYFRSGAIKYDRYYQHGHARHVYHYYFNNTGEIKSSESIKSTYSNLHNTSNNKQFRQDGSLRSEAYAGFRNSIIDSYNSTNHDGPKTWIDSEIIYHRPGRKYSKIIRDYQEIMIAGVSCDLFYKRYFDWNNKLAKENFKIKDSNSTTILNTDNFNNLLNFIILT